MRPEADVDGVVHQHKTGTLQVIVWDKMNLAVIAVRGAETRQCSLDHPGPTHFFVARGEIERV